MYARKRAGLAGVNTEAAVSTWIISTPQVDRDGDRVGQFSGRAWKINNFVRQGGPVLLDHGANDSRPVASVVNPASGECELWRQGDVTCCRMHHNLSTQLGRDCWALVQDGILNGASLGFLPDRPQKRAGGRGHDIETLELLEISLVATPSNPGCYRIDSAKSARTTGRRQLVLKSASRAAREAEFWALALAEVRDLRWKIECEKERRFEAAARNALRPL